MWTDLGDWLGRNWINIAYGAFSFYLVGAVVFVTVFTRSEKRGKKSHHE